MMKNLVSLFLLVLLVSATSFAQHTVTGTVIDETGEPIPGANVIEKENVTNGTITDIDGNYTLVVQSTEAIVSYSFIGFETVEEAVGGRTEINVTLTSDVEGLDEVIVTALGIKREKKALGYAVQDVKSEQLTQTGSPDLINSLEGKVAGVNINQSGGGVGGTSRIDIRGSSSLIGNDQPIWVVDGVPFDNGGDRDGTVWGGTSRSGGAFDLNPDDIETISILKGPNAAALYGERGGNGVILVTTKKGSRNKGLGISYSGVFTASEAAYMLDLQDRYGQGNDGAYDNQATGSWGPEMNGQDLESWTGETIPYTAQKDRLKDFTRTGTTQKHTLAFTGGNDDGTYRVSIGKDIINGIYEGHEVEKTSFDVRADYDINPWLNVDTKISFFNTTGNNRPEIGNYSYVSYFNSMPMNIRNEDLAPGYDIIGGKHVEKLYTTANANYRNPYFLQAQTVNNDEKNRTFGYVAANLKLAPGLTGKLKYGMDFYQMSTVEGYLYGDNVDANRPNYNPAQQKFKEENTEFLLSYNKAINDDFTIGLNVGGNNRYSHRATLSASSGKLTSEGDFFLGAGSNINANERFEELEVRSIYGFGQVAYKNYLFFDFTGRKDWSSTLTSNHTDFNNGYFYPSFSLSGIISDMIEMPQWITLAKIRGSWARVGKATEPYFTAQNYSISNWNYDLSVGNVPDYNVDSNLESELSTSTEIGADLRFFQNRLGLDFTYYYEATENQIGYVKAVEEHGSSQTLTNIGKILNEGIEVTLSTVPFKNNDWRIGLDFNFAMNEGTLVKLKEGIPRYDFGSSVVAYEGGKLGDILGSVYNRNEEGQLIVDENGLMTINTDDNIVIGNIQADWTGAINLSVDYKGLFLTSLISVQEGGDIVSSSERSATSAGTAAQTTENNRISFFVDGVTEDGGINTTMISAEEYWRQVSKVDEEFVYDASHMKLRELAIGYNLPKSLLAKIPSNPVQSVRLSFVGRNLWYFYKNTPGTVPDASAYSTNYAAQAYDFSPVPSTRTYGFSLNVGF
ncbi:SusC/RagA family TonB-linked outer membrane protein [Carboxylicivirga sp. N1Y90]|uniref:SusC/RagA family TonB-linked outer membrane protein n=1 Tax=Carboxylicivirga fragile TaxID=3417571 RepID=UPI003D3343A2|nr:SusC/RagA family TonB-linked outer membrane protein [Marinilabiliaceae bacterium N1Y90]